MSENKAAGRGWLWGRRILSVIAGFVAVVILSVVTDKVLEGIGVFPPPDRGLFDTGLLLIAISYRSLYTIAGAYITARLAPDHPMRHTLALGVIGLVAGSFGAISATSQNLGPAWYAWGLAISALPLTWIGGKLAELQPGRRLPHQA